MRDLPPKQGAQWTLHFALHKQSQINSALAKGWSKKSKKPTTWAVPCKVPLPVMTLNQASLLRTRESFKAEKKTGMVISLNLCYSQSLWECTQGVHLSLSYLKTVTNPILLPFWWILIKTIQYCATDCKLLILFWICQLQVKSAFMLSLLEKGFVWRAWLPACFEKR